MTTLLSRWFRTSPNDARPSIAVIVYSRSGCGCCEKALNVLEREGSGYPLKVEVIDIDEDPRLIELHSTSVPVVEINGKIRFRGVVNPILLARLLKAEH